MRQNMYVFHVDGHDRIHPQFIQAALTRGSTKESLQLTIRGKSGSSLLAITACSDYFEPKEEIEYEWNFVVDDSIPPSKLIAILE